MNCHLFAFLLAAALVAVPSTWATVTVTAEPAVEGAAIGEPRSLRFTLTLSPPSTVPTVWEVATSADSAREGIDYVGVRGAATIPAHTATAVVEVPIIADAWKEPTESLALLVWPQGGSPLPSLSLVATPAFGPDGESPFTWPEGPVGVSEQTFFIGPSLGVMAGDGGQYDREWALPSSSQPQIQHLAGSGRWMAAVDGVVDLSSHDHGRTRLYVADRLSSPVAPLPATPALVLPGAYGSPRSVQVEGDVAGVFCFGALRFFQLSADGPAQLTGQCLLPGAEEALFGGRRVASYSSNPTRGVQIYEADGPDLARWRLVATLPGTKRLAAFDGERLILRHETSGSSSRTELHIHERQSGGPSAWGESAILSVDDAEEPRRLGPVVLAGSLLLVGDGSTDLGAGPRPGKVHVFGLGNAGGRWSSLGAFAAPNPLPGDGFGGRLAVAGNDLLVATAAQQLGMPNAAWIGRLPGGRATIVDDDAPMVRVVGATEFEPEGSPLPMTGWLTLTHPSPDPITVAWRTVGVSATTDQDFVGVSTSTVIPAGSLAAPIAVSLLPDAVLEADEVFLVEITGAAGASADPAPPARWTVRDTDRSPVVFAPQADAYEGLSSPSPEIRLYPAGTELAVPWSLREIAPAPDGAPSWFGGLAQAGSDFAPASGTLTSTNELTASIDVAALRDGVQEPKEFASLAVDLDPLVSAASYGTRQVATLTGLPDGGSYAGHVTTDGDRVAVMVRLPGQGSSTHKAVYLYDRDPGAAGGWRLVRLLRLADFGIPDDAGLDFMKLRNGRLCYFFPPIGRVWILAEDPSPAGTWRLEASFASRFGPDSAFQADAEFDGEVFVTSRRSGLQGNQIYIHERGTGDWAFHQDLQVNGLSAPVIFEGHSMLARLDNGAPGFTDYLVVERSGYGASPWVRRANLTVPVAVATSHSPPKLDRDLLVLSGSFPETTRVYRRRPGGSWEFEQGLMTHAIGLDRGVVLGVSNLSGDNSIVQNRTYADVGTAPHRWHPLAEPESSPPPPFAIHDRTVFDHCRRVLVGSVDIPGSTPGAPSVAGHFIAEPGADIRFIDSESLVIYAHQLGFGEGYNTEALPQILLQSSLGRLPIDLTIPYQTTGTGTATPGVDFRPVSGTVLLRAGTVETSLAVPLLPDGILEPTEWVHVALGPPNFGTVQPAVFQMEIPHLFPHNFATLPRPPVLFEPLAGQQTFTVPVVLAYGFAAPITASYTISAVTASAADVVLGSGTVTLPAGHTTLPIPLTVLADTLDEAPELVRLSLTSLDTVPLTRVEFDLFIDDRPTPGGVSDAFSTTADTALDFTPARSVLANDGPGTSTIEAARAPQSGTVTWQPDGTFRYEPAPQFVGIDRFAYRRHVAGVSLLDATATWRWLHPLDGQDPGTTTPGFQADWMKPAFDDAAWATGTGLMGYGTLGVSPGETITTPIGVPSANRYSAYFRTTFTGPPTPTTGLSLRFACDDAAIFYLNGTEIGRYAKAPDPDFLTAPDTYRLLSTNFHDFQEETEIRTLTFPSAQLLSGPNVLAVSVHNQSPSSSDLGLKVTDLNMGYTTHPVLVEVTITDAGAPPRVTDDARTAPSTTTPLDSLFLPPGSVYANDGLLSVDGTPYDAIVEAEIGGNPIGPVTFNKETGHFRITGAPAGFFGDTSFTYRIRDKDGWSNTATVTVTVQPSRAFDIWRQAQFSGGSRNTLSLATADHDGDSLVNLAEFAFATHPAIPNFSPVLELTRQFGSWVAEFTVQNGFGTDAVIDLEFTPTLGTETWVRLARLNDVYPTIEEYRPGIEKTTLTLPQNRTRYSLSLPAAFNPHGFLRLRVSQERHAMDP